MFALNPQVFKVSIISHFAMWFALGFPIALFILCFLFLFLFLARDLLGRVEDERHKKVEPVKKLWAC